MRALPILLLMLFAACATANPARASAGGGLPVDSQSAPVSAVWIGHATVLLRMGDALVLADPNFKSRQVIYPRLTQPSVLAAALPPIDLVVVSHLHDDHFDPDALRALGAKPIAIFPAGAESYTRRLPEALMYLRPWASTTVHGVTVTAVPVSHAGGRYLVDGLWNHAFAGYVLQAGGHTVFFAGDTGYHPTLFKEIRRRFPDIELCFVPIAPARGGNRNHASPSEALDIFQDLGARYFVPIHFEGFYSAAVPYDEPRRLLETEVARRDLGARVFALHTGERLLVPDDAPPTVVRDVAAR